MTAVYGIGFKIKNKRVLLSIVTVREVGMLFYQECKLQSLSPKSVCHELFMDNFILPGPGFATKADVFGNKFIEKRLLYSINIIYVPAEWRTLRAFEMLLSKVARSFSCGFASKK